MPDKILIPKGLALRVNLPRYVRYAAIVAAVAALAVVVIALYRGRNPEFRMKGFPAQLSKDVIASVNGYERRETDGERLKYAIKADKATTFADNHQELENVVLQVYAPDGSFDNITAQKAVYIPEQDKNFTAYFAGSVNVQTRDGLNVTTEQVTYKKAAETISMDETVQFRRLNVRGTAAAASVDVPAKSLQLTRDVKIEAFDPENPGVLRASMSAASAAYDQMREVIDVSGGMIASIWPTATNRRKTDVSADRAGVRLNASENAREFSRIELFDNVRVETSEPGQRPTTIASGYALYDKLADTFDLKRTVEIVTVKDEKPTTAKAEAAVYNQKSGKITLTGGAEVSDAANVIKGDSINADLSPDRKVAFAAARGNAALRQTLPDRITEASADQLSANFTSEQVISSAKSIGQSLATITPVGDAQYSRISLAAARSIALSFAVGLLSEVKTDGRTTIQLDSASGDPNGSNKRLTADVVTTTFAGDGKSLQRAEASGNAELAIDPIQATPASYFTRVNAPQFDCSFYQARNIVRVCTGGTNTRTERTPKIAASDRGTQILTARTLVAAFAETPRELQSLDARGDAKFTELERNAVAENINFDNGDGRVRLRGGEPTVWDDSARAKAAEVDWDTRGQRSFLRGNVSTTYYSQRQTGSAAPFGAAAKPVFLTSSEAEIDHANQVAVYTGNARAWQENSFVRADKLTIMQKEGRFLGDGSVQSVLYDAKRKENGRETTVPVYAGAGSLAYDRGTRLLKYQDNVDIRQGTDRITGGSANVFLNDRNEVAKTDIERDVVIAQPKRRAVGDFASYDQTEDTVILRGSPARVDDAESGSSQGAVLSINLKSNRVESQGKSFADPVGRTRSVYKVKGT